MFKKELLIPALLGLVVYAQSSDISLCNNTTILLLLYMLLERDNIFDGYDDRRGRACRYYSDYDCGRQRYFC